MFKKEQSLGGKVFMFFRLPKPMFFLFDACNNGSYCDKWHGVGVRARS